MKRRGNYGDAGDGRDKIGDVFILINQLIFYPLHPFYPFHPRKFLSAQTQLNSWLKHLFHRRTSQQIQQSVRVIGHNAVHADINQPLHIGGFINRPDVDF